jgi:uncharacterized protein (TIGR03083 family)
VTPEALAAQQHAFAVLAAAVDPTAEVPGCPGWRAADVVTHLAGVHRWAAAMSLTAPGDTAPHEVPGDIPPDPVADYRAAAAELLDVLGRDPSRPCLTLRGTGVAGDWYRRQLHETLVHSWDLADAGGLPRWGSAAVVADAVSEVLDTLTPRQVRLGRLREPGAAVELLGSRRWVLGPGPVVASVAGPDAELVRLLWRRRTLDGREVDGREVDGREVDGLELRGDTARARALLALPLTP